MLFKLTFNYLKVISFIPLSDFNHLNSFSLDRSKVNFLISSPRLENSSSK